ncbi:MAG: toll/interleukin-1 receptor domain-containing protein [Desulfobulbaceae bacterium]|nr:toll/interleukin-1 receptor domain-containing protein [Desulfobulbaceae bacterium]
MPHDVFITYSSTDRVTGDAVCAALEARGIDCWIAPRNLLPGRSWGGAIIEALEQSRLMVLVYTSNSNKSQQVLREVERAVSKNIKILPLRLEEIPLSSDLEYFLSSCQWMEAVSPPLEKHLKELADIVNRLLGKGKRAEPLERSASNSIPAATKRPVWLIHAVAAAIAILCITLFFLFGKSDKKTASIEKKQAAIPAEESTPTLESQKIDPKPAEGMVRIPVVHKVAQKPVVDEINRKPAEGAVRIPVVHKVAQKPIMNGTATKTEVEATGTPTVQKTVQKPITEKIDRKPVVHKVDQKPGENAAGTSTSLPVGRMLNEDEW